MGNGPDRYGSCPKTHRGTHVCEEIPTDRRDAGNARTGPARPDQCGAMRMATTLSLLHAPSQASGRPDSGPQSCQTNTNAWRPSCVRRSLLKTEQQCFWSGLQLFWSGLQTVHEIFCLVFVQNGTGLLQLAGSPYHLQTTLKNSSMFLLNKNLLGVRKPNYKPVAFHCQDLRRSLKAHPF